MKIMGFNEVIQQIGGGIRPTTQGADFSNVPRVTVGSIMDIWILVIQPGENQALPTTSAREKIQQVFNIHQHTMARCWNYHTFCQQE